MKMVLSIHISKKKGEIGHTTQQVAGGDNIVFGISWSPNSDEIACIFGKGIVKIFNTKKGTIKHEIKPGGKGFRIAWNQLNSKYILSSANDGRAYLLTFDETGQIVVKKSYNHNSKPVFGVSWSRFESTNFATGCDDGHVRVFDFAIDQDPIVLKGHTARVFNIAWHPHSAKILASGSNDNTIRVWNIEDKS